MPKLGEFEIIERYFARSSDDARVLVGIGDDAAIVDARGPIAVAVDTLVAGTHFPPGLPAAAVGHRALAVNLSDLAAVGAAPRWATLALCVPQAEPDWLESFADGFFALADRWRVGLIGGDTTRGPLSITVQLIGDASEHSLLRSGGQAGDRVFVSGTLGDAAAALELVGFDAMDRSDNARALIERFGFPVPRVALGQALAGLARAAIDVSDGLVADLGHLCRHSGCGAVIDLEALPLSPALLASCSRERAEAFALGGGDDYELCFTCAEANVAEVLAVAERAETVVTEIGRLVAEPGIHGRRGDERVPLTASGFTHF